MSRPATRSKRSNSDGPSLGIWWDAGPQGLLSVRVPFVHSENDVAVTDAGKLHANEWRRMQRAHPALLGRHYFDLPHGRVVRPGGMFVVQMGEHSVNLPDLRDKIIRVFRLPRDNTVFVHDPEQDPRRTASMPFPLWLNRQLQRSDEVGFFARLALDHAASVQLRAAIEHPDALELTYSTAGDKVATSARTALAEWREGEPLPVVP